MSKSQHNRQPFLLLGTTSEGESITLTVQSSPFLWISGISGSGKSTLIAWLVLSLLRMGYTVVGLDPHGDTVRLIVSCLGSTDFYPRGFDRLHFIDFNRQDSSIGFNVLRQEHTDNYKVAQNFLQAIHRSFPSSSGAATTALDNTIEYSAFVLAENGMPITQLQRFLLDASFRNNLLRNIKDQQITQFFDYKFADKVSSQLIDSTMRRLDILTFSPLLRRALGQKTNKLNFRSLWEKNISCLISLGGLTDAEKRLAGCLLLVSIEQHFLSRLELPPEKRSKVALIVDEAPLFISQDETSFTTIIDQCRKAGAVCTTFANQTLTQLSKGMLGSLQQALPIIMRAGSSDSGELASRFYRPKQEQKFDFFGLKRTAPGAFDKVNSSIEARMIFERLPRQTAIVMFPNRAVKITTPTIPVKIDQKKLTEIENEYARRLLTPISQIEREHTKSNLVLVSNTPTFKRRTFEPSLTQSMPLVLFTDDLEQDIHAALSCFSYATLTQLATLLSREKSINYLRKKLSSLVDESKISVTLLPRTTGGKPLQIYCAPGISDRKQLFLDHSLDCTQALIAGLQVPTLEPSLHLVRLKDERSLKAVNANNQSPIIPDGLLSYQTQSGEIIHIALEIDRSTSNDTRIKQKFLGYPAWIKQTGLDALTIAFVVTAGDSKRVLSLMEIVKETIGDTDLASLFLFAYIPGEKITPHVFLDPVFRGLDNSSHAIIEQPF